MTKLNDFKTEKLTIGKLSKPKGKFDWQKASIEYEGKDLIFRTRDTKTKTGVKRFDNGKYNTMSFYVSLTPQGSWVTKTEEELEHEKSDLKILEKFETSASRNLKQPVRFLRRDDSGNVSILLNLQERKSCIITNNKEIVDKKFLVKGLAFNPSNISITTGNEPSLKSTLVMAVFEPLEEVDFSEDHEELFDSDSE